MNITTIINTNKKARKITLSVQINYQQHGEAISNRNSERLFETKMETKLQLLPTITVFIVTNRRIHPHNIIRTQPIAKLFRCMPARKQKGPFGTSSSKMADTAKCQRINSYRQTL
jgi:hypothetical protein